MCILLPRRSWMNLTCRTLLTFHLIPLVMQTLVNAITVTGSRWVLEDSAAGNMLSERLATRSKITCAGTCRQTQCSRFAFSERSGSCLLGNARAGSLHSVAGHAVYGIAALQVTTVQPETTQQTTEVVPSKCRLDLDYRYDAKYDTCIKHVFQNQPKLTWKQSEQKCRDDGGHLYNINDNNKLEALKAHFKAAGITPWTQWIGASDEAQEGDWRWTDGTSANAMLQGMWEGSNPDNWGPTGEDYVLIYGATYDMVDKSINDVSEGYICEIDM